MLNDFSQTSKATTAYGPADYTHMTISVENGPVPLRSLVVVDMGNTQMTFATIDYAMMSQCIENQRRQEYPILWLDDTVDPSNTNMCYQETATSGFTVSRVRKSLSSISNKKLLRNLRLSHFHVESFNSITY